MAQPTRTSRLLSESLPSSFPVIPHGNAVSHFRFLLLCTNEVEKGDYSNKKAEGFLAAYLTRVASDLLRRLYHALCGTVQAALTTLHIVSDSGLFPRGRR